MNIISKNDSRQILDIQNYKDKLRRAKNQLDNKEIDEIPLDIRAPMLDIDYDKEAYIIVSYSRKDFEEVYLFLASMYNEGYRFWYDNGMKGTKKWLQEYKEKFENPNCLGTITFFSDNYISNSTKEELSMIYTQGGYIKRNVMISLVPINQINSDNILKNAIINDRISIENAAEVKPVLTQIINEEKEKTIHRYSNETDISPLMDKIGEDFHIRCTETEKKTATVLTDFFIHNGELIKYLGNDKNVVIPDGVVRIAPEAFKECESLVNIKIPDGVIGIGERAFCGCKSLTDILFPEGLEQIGDEAFDNCCLLENILLPKSLMIIGDGIFADCQNLTNIELPIKITGITSGMFNCCDSLKNIIIPPNVEYIGVSAFFECMSLETITLTNMLDEIDALAFANCNNLKNINFIGSAEEWKTIQKGFDWHRGVPTTKVICTDGEVNIK